MSNRWPGGVIRKTPVTPAGPLQSGAASGVWSLADAAYWTKQGLWPLAGNTLAVEDVFSTYLYTGNSSTQTITNGINLSGQGGMVWVKQRNSAQSHRLYDTSRGVSQMIASNTTSAQANTSGFGVTNFANNGFTLVDSGSNYGVNFSGQTYASWTFREAPKFFDVVTYTGNGVAGRQIAHNLGVAPGMMIVKMTSGVEGWYVYHRGTSSPATKALVLNTTDAENAGTVGYWNSTAPTSTNFTLGSNYEVNNNGSTYVAYLYAHDAASDGIIQCGSFTSNSSGVASVDLGWEPQWVLLKPSSTTGNWFIFDNMRGWSVGSSDDAALFPDRSNAEIVGTYGNPTATGFELNGWYSSATSVYVAIRRGPMKTPTLGTSVYSPILTTSGNPTGTVITTGFPVDMQWNTYKSFAENSNTTVVDRLRGVSSTTTSSGVNLVTSSTAAQNTSDATTRFWGNTGYQVSSSYGGNSNIITQNFRRAPGFFDEVCYTGTGVARTLNHNLGVVPELMIVKIRDFADSWRVYYYPNSTMLLNGTSAGGTASSVLWNNTDPTSTVFSVGTDNTVNGSGANYVAYLFASCPGVSKVGTYTGNGSSQTINCAFTTGARFVLIKRTDSTGGWLVWDSARGIVAGNDPYLALNSTAAEVTTNDSVDTDNTGFIVNQVAASNINVNGGTYIFLAIA
jgi:hypothetical protein